MKSTKGKNADALPRSRKDSLSLQEKPVRVGNPIELTRVKLQEPIRRIPDGVPSSMWSSDGIVRTSRLYQRSSSTPPSHARLDLPNYSVPRNESKPGLHQSYRIPTVTIESSQHDEDSDDRCISNSVGIDIQRCWSAPPVADQDVVLDDNQDEGRNGVSLRMGHLNLEEAPNSASSRYDKSSNIWSNHSQAFDKCNFLRGPVRVTGTTPLGSSSPSETQVLSDLSFSAPGLSNQESNASSSACSVTSSHDDFISDAVHAPPGLSLVDRIEDDFPRTSTPMYDSAQEARDQYPFGRDAKSNSAFDVAGAMGRMGIGDHLEDQYGGCARDSTYKFEDDLFRQGGSRCLANFDERFQQNRTLSRSISQPVYPPQMYFNKSTYACHPPLSSRVHVRPVAFDQTKLQWPVRDVYYPEAAALELSVPELGYGPSSNLRYGPDNEAKCGGIYGVLKASERLVRDQAYLRMLPGHSYDACDRYQSGFPRPNGLYRSKSGSSRRLDHEHLHPVAHSYSSNSLLEEFASSSKSEKWELSAIKGHLLLFARDQSGSRFIQQKLEKAGDQAKEDAFEEIYPNCLILMTDVFGNYVIQKFFEHGSLKQQQLLVEQMRTNMISLALQVYGCRVIQRALEVTQVAEQLSLIAELKGHVVKCITDQNGNHVLQKCIEAASWKKSVASGEAPGLQTRITGDDIQFIVDDVLGHAAALSTHSYGCRVIQRILEHCSPVQIRPIISEIIFKCRELVKDQFGNYVVQHVISHGEPDQQRVVMDAVFPEIGRWSQHKYASNVVEACLDHASKAEIARTIDFILQCDESGSSCPLLPMMKHMYGNYVVQKLLDKADPRDRQRIVCIIRHNADYLKRFTFGKHVLSRLERELAASYY